MSGTPGTRSGDGAREVADGVARRSSRRLVALLAARNGDVPGAEDALSSAFAAALADWPEHGVPANPEAWLLTVARRKAIDAARRRRHADEAAAQLRCLAEAARAGEGARGEPSDGRSALALVCGHPAVEPAMRAPLVLQALLGFEAAEIARVFEVRPAAMSQRLVRAKRRLRRAGAPAALSPPADLAARVDATVERVRGALARAGRVPEAPVATLPRAARAPSRAAGRRRAAP